MAESAEGVDKSAIRRRMLKVAGGAGAAIGTIALGYEAMRQEARQETIRNTIIAAKTLGLENNFPRNTEKQRAQVLLIYGLGHWGLPEYLMSNAQTLFDYLSLYPKPFWHTFFGKDNPHLYTSVTITPEGDGFRTERKENPDLKRIFGSAQ